MSTKTWTAWMLGAAMAAAMAAGCASRSGEAVGEHGSAVTGAGPATMRVEPSAYAATFDQAREELRDLGFILDRVDAQLGVITTQPKGTGGIATPWDQEQSGIGDRLEDAVQKQRRVVRIEFAPEGVEPGSAEIIDLRRETRPLIARVGVTIMRVHQPGWRLNPQAILESSYTHDPQLDERGMSLYMVPVRQDDELAARLVERIRDGLARPGR